MMSVDQTTWRHDFLSDVHKGLISMPNQASPVRLCLSIEQNSFQPNTTFEIT